MKIGKYIALLLTALCCTHVSSAQYNTGYNSTSYGSSQSWDTNIAIHADPRLDVLLHHHEYVRKNAKHTNRGYQGSDILRHKQGRRNKQKGRFHKRTTLT